MYVSPLSIYREYVQNSADAIDEAKKGGASRSGRVAMTFDHPSRSVNIRDNGSGIPADKAVDLLLAVGGSQKRGTFCARLPRRRSPFRTGLLQADRIRDEGEG